MEEKVHKRRVRYAGRYPKKFEEKYKEHDPEKYADTVAHVIEKGSTPAGMHISIMVKEILDFLEIRPGQQGTVRWAMADTVAKCWKSWKEKAGSSDSILIRSNRKRRSKGCARQVFPRISFSLG